MLVPLTRRKVGPIKNWEASGLKTISNLSLHVTTKPVAIVSSSSTAITLTVPFASLNLLKSTVFLLSAFLPTPLTHYNLAMSVFLVRWLLPGRSRLTLLLETISLFASTISFFTITPLGLLHLKKVLLFLHLRRQAFTLLIPTPLTLSASSRQRTPLQKLHSPCPHYSPPSFNLFTKTPHFHPTRLLHLRLTLPHLRPTLPHLMHRPPLPSQIRVPPSPMRVPMRLLSVINFVVSLSLILTRPHGTSSTTRTYNFVQ